MSIRKARVQDISALAAIEQQCFKTDLISRRQFRYLLTRANADIRVLEVKGQIMAYSAVLFRRGTALARLYSLAVLPQNRGQGFGTKLLTEAETQARELGAVYMRLEVRAEDQNVTRLYHSQGYLDFGRIADYYEDGAEAIRMQKLLAAHLAETQTWIPYYEQTLEFTCGASALMMAMNAHQADIELNRSLELRIWREATTIFMMSGHGGCGPFGLALAAVKRGFPAEVLVNDPGVPLLDSVRSADKKDVMSLVHADMLAQAQELNIPIHYQGLDLNVLQAAFRAGAIPLVLISSYRVYGEKLPHWVVTTGFDEEFVYTHDPYVNREQKASQTDCMNTPIPRAEFTRMARYGRAGLQAAVIIHPKQETIDDSSPTGC